MAQNPELKMEVTKPPFFCDCTAVMCTMLFNYKMQSERANYFNLLSICCLRLNDTALQRCPVYNLGNNLTSKDF